MAVKAADEQILVRIGFAQRWLERARRYYSEGNPARSVLTLALAHAEVRCALEAAGLAPRRASRAPAAALAALAAAAIVAGMWVGLAGSSGSAQAPGGPAVVRLPETAGSLLATLSFPAPGGSPAPSPARPPRRSPPASAPAAPPAAAAPARVLPSPPPPPVLQAPPEPPAVREVSSPPALSVDELVELILTADRALRREPVAP